MTNQTPADSLTRFLEIMAKLRDPRGGCPWDIKQTFESLKPLLIEEAYEVADAVDKGPEAIKEELGDLVSLIGLFSQIAAERSVFSFASVLDGISEKLVRRHPHVFGESKVSGSEEVLKNWEQIKQEERKNSSEASKGLLDGIPRSLPALLAATQIGERCRRVGFDWGSHEGVAEKVREEVEEFLSEAAKSQVSKESLKDNARAVEEFGDLLFSLAQLSRHLDINAEGALSAANAKFTKRFQLLEKLARERFGDKPLIELGDQTLEELWNAAKKG
jgi:MazG family protein